MFNARAGKQVKIYKLQKILTWRENTKHKCQG